MHETHGLIREIEYTYMYMYMCVRIMYLQFHYGSTEFSGSKCDHHINFAISRDDT